MAHLHKVSFAVLLVVCYAHVNFAFSLPDSELEKSDNDDAVRPDQQASDDSEWTPRNLGARGIPGVSGTVGGSGGGSVYTRWGRKVCPSGTTLLYEGVMGGSFYTLGGGSNYLCMPLNPIYDKTVAGYQGYSYLYGTEYEMNAHASLFPNNLHDHDATCAVCLAESRGSQVMIPARNVCPAGWTLEYKGYLMADHIAHRRSEFICVDSAPTARPGSHLNLNGALLYVVESFCGSLPCSPYVAGGELTCAVCTK